jgi:hypothetical protein
MNPVLKNGLTAIGAIIVAGIAVWLANGGNRAVLSWFGGPTIGFWSISRGDVSPFFAGEVVRFSLKGAAPDRVIWQFDESEVQAGGVEIEHAFPFDARKPLGIASTHRVDVFFREGAPYRTAVSHFGVDNVRFVSAKIEGKTISLLLNPDQGAAWKLRQVSLGRFEGGVFKTGTAIPTPTDRPPGSITLDQSLLERLGITFGRDLNPGSNLRADPLTASLEFVSSDSKRRLQTVQDLAPQIRQLQAAFADLPPTPPEPYWKRKGGEPYRVKKGDSLFSIGHRYGISVGLLMAANDIPDADSIHAGQVLTIPVAALRAASASSASSSAEDLAALRKGLDEGWVVTRNPAFDSHKLFVHRSMSGGVLTDLQYLIEESADGSTWTIYRPRWTGGGSEYGARVGVIRKPANISIGDCDCM